MSADVLTTAAQQERAQQVDYYLHKPCPLQQLEAIVDTVLVPVNQALEIDAEVERQVGDTGQ